MSTLLTVSITDVDNNIAIVQESLSIFPRSHPMYNSAVHTLAKARFLRYTTYSHKKEDLDKSILHYTESILLPNLPPPPPIFGGIPSPKPNIIETLFRLAIALLERSDEFEQPDGIKYVMEYLRYIRGFPLDSFDVPRTVVTTSLIQALGAQIEWGAGDWTREIKEMVVLCNELLTSNQPKDVPTAAVRYLGEAATHIAITHGFPSEMLDDMIDCLRDAVKVCPLAAASHKVMFALANALGKRFMEAHSKNEDYDEATVILERILEPGGCPDSFRVWPLMFAVTLPYERSIFCRAPEYSIFRSRNFSHPSRIQFSSLR